MATVRCPRGHMYDDRKFSSCPSCPVVDDVRVENTVANSPAGGGGRAGAGRAAADNEGMTISAGSAGGGGIDPVVGWLVCIGGVNKGRDFRLHSEANKVGRSTAMDVCIEGDQTISRDTHCQVVYSPRHKRFSIVPGIGRNLVYVDGEELLAAMTLKAYQKIEIGDSVFLFMPFCSDQFSWGEDGANAAEPEPDTSTAPDPGSPKTKGIG